MDKLSLHAKKAWFAKHRTANFENSLRLEGFIVPPDDGKAKLPAVLLHAKPCGNSRLECRQVWGLSRP